MSVMSAGINSLTTATTVDFYQRVFRPGHSPKHYAKVGRIGNACLGPVVTLLAFLAGHLGELDWHTIASAAWSRGPCWVLSVGNSDSPGDGGRLHSWSSVGHGGGCFRQHQN